MSISVIVLETEWGWM